MFLLSPLIVEEIIQLGFLEEGCERTYFFQMFLNGIL